jgi:hypothetical protein
MDALCERWWAGWVTGFYTRFEERVKRQTKGSFPLLHTNEMKTAS